MSDRILEHHYSHCDRKQWSENTVDYDDLKHSVQHICVDDLTFDLVLNDLCNHGKATIIRSSGSKVNIIHFIGTTLMSTLYDICHTYIFNIFCVHSLLTEHG